MSDHQRAAQHAPYESEAPQPRKRLRTTVAGGRPRPRYQLALEALVNTTASPAQLTTLRPEERKICHLCRATKAVAEVSALLSIPLQAVRALIAELADAGLVTISQPGGTQNAGGTPDAALIERVLNGLRRDTAEAPATEDAQDGSVEEWLADSYREFADALGDVLDTEGGLREILLQSDHDTAVDDLGDLLDIEAGLREALGMRLETDTASFPPDLLTATEPLWSYKEIATHIGVQPETVRAYRKHGLLPSPDVVDEGKPYWFADTVRAWGARRVSPRHRQDPND
ncbi:hypothetical protein SANT12839_099610 [Streptomyces antimycoticus]|uniref:HTH merR-type domain-containing protein n=1 Tax=Streptomyces antimycoticus TaxID=68175 RepID=A0A4D4KT99_9ACTN|nr:hypothetical protein SANT12839_099610 [Streptomyces antimycoticus]